MRILVLENPASGTPSRRRRAAVLLQRLRSEGAEVEVVAPASAEAMRDCARRARRSQHDVVLVSGGDGTLHRAVNGLFLVPRDQRPLLAVLPAGRGNDFAAELGIRSEADALRAILSGRTRAIDLGRAPEGVFLGIAGTGFDACAARRARKTPILSGSFLYTYAVLRTLAEYRPLQARVCHEGGSFEGPLTFAAVGNTARYGGGMRICPRADLEDGLLDLCLVHEISAATLLWMFPTVFWGRHLSHPKVEYHRTRFVTIETEIAAEVFADGELLQRTPVRIDLLPRELECLALPEPFDPAARS